MVQKKKPLSRVQAKQQSSSAKSTHKTAVGHMPKAAPAPHKAHASHVAPKGNLPVHLSHGGGAALPKASAPKVLPKKIVVSARTQSARPVAAAVKPSTAPKSTVLAAAKQAAGIGPTVGLLRFSGEKPKSRVAVENPITESTFKLSGDALSLSSPAQRGRPNVFAAMQNGSSTPPGTPKASTPGAPKATPGAPKATPGAPKATPGAPKATPGAPKATPGAPKATPGAPASTSPTASTPAVPKATPSAVPKSSTPLAPKATPSTVPKAPSPSSPGSSSPGSSSPGSSSPGSSSPGSSSPGSSSPGSSSTG
jgi:hypothetical protein